MNHEEILKDAAWLDTLYLRLDNHHLMLSIEVDKIVRSFRDDNPYDKSRPLEIYKEAQTMMHIFRDAPSASTWSELYWLYDKVSEKAKNANKLINGR